MMSKTGVKFGVFGVVMAVLTAGLFAIFGEYRTGSTQPYTAVFTDASDLGAGDSVRVAGIRVGTVDAVRLQPDNTVQVDFDIDDDVRITESTAVAVRYLNLVGDRYLELMDRPGPARIQQPGSVIAADRTEPALDLDLLLGGLKPVIRGLNPQDVNALTTSLIQILQGESGNVESLFARTSSFTNALADNGQTVEQLIDNLRQTLQTVSRDGQKFSTAVNRLEELITGLATGTSSLAGLLTDARPPLSGTVDQLNRLAPLLSNETNLARLDLALQKTPANYRKLVRLGSYGSWLNLYICGVSIRVSDLEGRTAHFPWVIQNTGRCSEP
jgi:phospholipid/cholesterol/gamma-HCH transport system substrate-binding protein